MGDEMGEQLTHGVDDDTLARLAAFAAALPAERKDDTWNDRQDDSMGAPELDPAAAGPATTAQAPALAVSPSTTMPFSGTLEMTTDEVAIAALWDWETFNADLDLAEWKGLDTDADPSPNPGAAKLRRYWTRGPGAAKIGWGAPGQFDRCVSHLGKYVGDAKGLCAVYYKAATGQWPGHRKDDADGAEVKAAHASSDFQQCPRCGSDKVSFPDGEQPRCASCGYHVALKASAKADQPDHSSGVMVAVYPSPDVAAKVAVKGGSPAEELHVTLAYLGDVTDVDGLNDRILEATRTAAAAAAPLTGKVGGLGRFPKGDDGVPVWTPVDVPGLSKLREAIVAELEDAGVDVRHDHGFAPHMTLGYDIDTTGPDDVPVQFGHVAVVLGEDRHDIPLGKPAAATTNRKEDAVGVETKTSMKADGSWDFDAVDMGLLPPSTGTDLNGPTGDASEYKEVGAQVIEVDKRRGIVTAIVSVTGKKDRVDDVIHPGAYKKTLTDRTPKGVWSHSWEQPVSKTLEVDELHPGDSRLPKEMRGAVGAPVPWPSDAGGLLVKTQFNLLGDRGKQAFADVVFFGDQQEWSIGYKVPPGGSQVKGGTRHIYDLELYEYSPVLFGAMPAAATMTVKSAQAAFKAALTADELVEFADLRAEVKAFDESAVTRNEDGEFAPKKGSGYNAKGKDDATVKAEQMSTKQVQESLVKLGILGAGSGKNGGVDGLFGPKTEAALKKFQRDNGLPESGAADKATMAKLSGADAPKPAADAPAAATPAAAGTRVPLMDRPSDGAKPDTNYDDGTGSGWDYKPGPSAVSSKGKVAEDGTPTATPAKGKPVGQVDGDMVYDDGAKFTAKGWSEDVVPAATVKKLAEDRNAKRASAGMAPIPVPTYATTGKSPLVKPATGKKEADVDPETKTDMAGWPIEEFKAAFPGAAPPFGSKPGKGKDEADDKPAEATNDDGEKPDPGKSHKFVKGPGGKCKVCGKDFAGHMAAQRESATGDSKALQDLWDDATALAETHSPGVTVKSWSDCIHCTSTKADEFTDGTAACAGCGVTLTEAKAGRVLSGVNTAALLTVYESLGDLLRKAGAMEGKSEQPTVEVEVPATETIEVPVEEPISAPAPVEEKALLSAEELAEMRTFLA